MPKFTFLKYGSHTETKAGLVDNQGPDFREGYLSRDVGKAGKETTQLSGRKSLPDRRQAKCNVRSLK